MAWNLISNIYTGKHVEKIAQIRIKNNDVFNLQFLYDRMHDWFVEEGWGPSSNDAFGERLFKKVEKQNGSKDFRIEWRLKRQVTPYITMTWDLDFNILGIQKKEIMHHGKKISIDKCDTDINMVIRIAYDYGGEWSKHWFLKHMSIIFPKRIYKEEIVQYKDKAYRDAYALQQTIKDYWKFKRWVDEPEFGTLDSPLGLPHD